MLPSAVGFFSTRFVMSSDDERKAGAEGALKASELLDALAAGGAAVRAAVSKLLAGSEEQQAATAAELLACSFADQLVTTVSTHLCRSASPEETSAICEWVFAWSTADRRGSAVRRFALQLLPALMYSYFHAKTEAGAASHEPHVDACLLQIYTRAAATLPMATAAERDALLPDLSAPSLYHRGGAAASGGSGRGAAAPTPPAAAAPPSSSSSSSSSPVAAAGGDGADAGAGGDGFAAPARQMERRPSMVRERMALAFPSGPPVGTLPPVAELTGANCARVLGVCVVQYLSGLPSMAVHAKQLFARMTLALLGGSDGSSTFTPLTEPASVSSDVLCHMATGLVHCAQDAHSELGASAAQAIAMVHSLALDRMDAGLLSITSVAMIQLMH